MNKRTEEIARLDALTPDAREYLQTADLVEVVRCRDCKRKNHCRIYAEHFGDDCFCCCGGKEG